MTHTRRYRLICQCGCGQRFRSSRPDTQYKDDSHRQHAFRQEKKAEALQAAINERRRADVLRQSLQHVEQARQEREQREAQERADIERAAKWKADAPKRQEQERQRVESATKIKPCPTCGYATWLIVKPSWWAEHMNKRPVMLECPKCGFEQPSPVQPYGGAPFPPKCSRCLSDEHWYIDRFGMMTCRTHGFTDRDHCGTQKNPFQSASGVSGAVKNDPKYSEGR